MTYTLYKTGPTGYVHVTQQSSLLTLWRHGITWGNKPGWTLIVEPNK